MIRILNRVINYLEIISDTSTTGKWTNFGRATLNAATRRERRFSTVSSLPREKENVLQKRPNESKLANMAKHRTGQKMCQEREQQPTSPRTLKPRVTNSGRNNDHHASRHAADACLLEQPPSPPSAGTSSSRQAPTTTMEQQQYRRSSLQETMPSLDSDISTASLGSSSRRSSLSSLRTIPQHSSCHNNNNNNNNGTQHPAWLATAGFMRRTKCSACNPDAHQRSLSRSSSVYDLSGKRGSIEQQQQQRPRQFSSTAAAAMAAAAAIVSAAAVTGCATATSEKDRLLQEDVMRIVLSQTETLESVAHELLGSEKHASAFLAAQQLIENALKARESHYQAQVKECERLAQSQREMLDEMQGLLNRYGIRPTSASGYSTPVPTRSIVRQPNSKPTSEKSWMEDQVLRARWIVSQWVGGGVGTGRVIDCEKGPDGHWCTMVIAGTCATTEYSLLPEVRWQQKK